MDEQWRLYRQNVLICAGLYDKVYGVPNDPDFPYKEWDKHNRQYRYYKVVPLAVTDEEFALIEQYSVIAKPL